jgi:ADP-ribose pyrophosphatase YjhB (NUDIX family)
MLKELHHWFTQLRAVSQYGLTYTKDVYDRERFLQVEAIANAIGSRLTGESELRVGQALTLEVGPPSPKLDVRAAVFRDDSILMVRESADGLWSLPGGWIDVGESAAHAAVREVKEETGYDCSARKLLAVLDRNQHAHPLMLMHVYKLIFMCDLLGGTPRTSVETTAVDFFPLEKLPPLSTSRISTQEIESAFRHRAQPELPTEFD